MTAARMTGMDSVAGVPATNKTTMVIINGAGRAAAVKAAMVQATESAKGMVGKMRCTAAPAAPLEKSRGNMGPPIKLLDIAPAVATILAKTRTITRPTPYAAPFSVTNIRLFDPKNIDKGRTMPSNPSRRPALVQRMIGRFSKGATSFFNNPNEIP